MSISQQYQGEPALQLIPGDREGFTISYNRFYLPIYYFTRKMLDNDQQAEDITAECFVKLWQQSQKGTEVHNVRAFLFVTARNACIDSIELKRSHSQKEKEILYLAQQENPDDITLSEIRAEVLQYIYTEIEKLPPKCRQVFKLSFLEGMKVPEVAATLGISEQTVSNQKTTALKVLRLALSDHQWMFLLMLIHSR